MNENNSVLIVDDDPLILDLLKTALSLEGYECKTTSNALHALDLIRKTHFDIMIADVVMPDMKGFELTEKAKRISPGMMVIITTGFADDFSYDKAIEAGASDFLKKPFTAKEVIARIKHVRSQEKIRNLLLHDDLTGIYNRRGFFTLVEHELKKAKRKKSGIFMLFADLDDLKKINDTWGHQEGDMALIETAGILRKNFRESDVVARIGGDEFVVFPVGTSGDCVSKILDRLQQAVDLNNAKSSRAYKLSLSAGIAYYDAENPCSIDELLARADKSMYERKRNKSPICNP